MLDSIQQSAYVHHVTLKSVQCGYQRARDVSVVCVSEVGPNYQLQNLINSSLVHYQSIPQISWKPARMFLSYSANKQTNTRLNITPPTCGGSQ